MLRLADPRLSTATPAGGLSFVVLFCAALLAPALMRAAGAAPVASGRSWSAIKCAHYREAWDHVLGQTGSDGLGARFLDSHAAFLKSGCTARADVCPRSSAEVAIAERMLDIVLNAGLSPTFAPFACRR